MKSKVHSFQEGLIAGLPLVIGYFPVAMAFGLLAKTVNISLLDSCLFSLLVFAGASQFMALDLIKAGIAMGDIVLATLLLNLRHAMMSASLAVRLTDVKKRWLPLLAFGITDESFAVAAVQPGKLSVPFLLALQGFSYMSWVAGTVAGYLLGSALPVSVKTALGVGLYAMFTAILVPEIRKSANILWLALLAGMIYAANHFFTLLPSGWGLIAAIILASLAGLLLLPGKAREEQP
ncbi:AzlC family ABC transporter permease [Sporomusa termitida]|uniref:AzlC: azaleucine resistance protein AzlC n=1 Tax=Sporomusa termitida TaxID=2377 RepID=A0A517DYJ7_9FIRM|nr:AzlC family ABC transporter permease [Sporomusa termitida]QDR82419.1 azlC: azaleucine resistance protein AzlC [Sporomusa termitida]